MKRIKLLLIIGLISMFIGCKCGTDEPEVINRYEILYKNGAKDTISAGCYREKHEQWVFYMDCFNRRSVVLTVSMFNALSVKEL